MAQEIVQSPTREVVDYLKTLNRSELKRYYSVFLRGFFNNFDANLPGGFNSKLSKVTLNKININDNFSIKRNELTRYQFLEECRLACEECEIHDQDLINARREKYNNPRQLIRLILPVYLNLRNKGFNYVDLVI